MQLLAALGLHRKLLGAAKDDAATALPYQDCSASAQPWLAPFSLCCCQPHTHCRRRSAPQCAQVNDRIMLLILADLLGAADNDPPEDSLEVMGKG